MKGILSNKKKVSYMKAHDRVHFLKTTNEQRTGKEFSHVHYIKAENIQHYKERKKKPVKDKPINQSSKQEQAFSNLNVNGSNSLLKDTKMNILVKKTFKYLLTPRNSQSQER